MLDANWLERDRHLASYELARYRRPSAPWSGSPGIHTLLGPRRIGKSTQFKLWIRGLIQQATPLTEVTFLDVERLETWQQLLSALGNFRGRYLFVDEVTSVRDWPRAFKVLVDDGTLGGVCVWLTGSNAFDLKNIGERLPGRRGRGHELRELELLPLPFRDFFAAGKPRHGGELKRAFSDFCQWGGYPMAVSEYLGAERPSADLLQELLDVALGETSRKHRSPRFSAALAERLWLNLAGRSSYHALSKQLDIGSHPVVRQYLEILEGCYAILSAERFNAKTRTGVLRKEKKFYFLDPLMMAALVTWSETGEVQPAWISDNWNDAEKQGRWIENVAAAELRKRQMRFFYDVQHGTEIDFVYSPIGSREWSALECKRSAPHPAEVQGLKAYPHAEIWIGTEDQARAAAADRRLLAPAYWIAERLLRFPDP